MIKTAELSECGTYRYRLGRVWDAEKPAAIFFMLNPSTADADVDDPTIRRCISFAKREGLGGLEVLNLMAYRATNPNDLPATRIAAGPHLAFHVYDALTQNPGPVIAAWGSHKRAVEMTDIAMFALELLKRQAYCLGTTKSGAPRHPLYVKGNTPLVPFTAKP